MTDYDDIRLEYEKSRPVVALLVIDNYEELIKNQPDRVVSDLRDAVEDKLTQWSDDIGGLIKRIGRDRYLLLFEEQYMLSDLRESGSIEQDADVVIGLYRDGYYNKECENPNLAEAIILKNRKGQTGTINLSWLPDYTSFVSLESRREDEY